ncbi:MAG: hypothetical protein IT303_13660 [Dehalococcoidia bacterium]|nr:hypothetical protein [Dehalococcoidia bacterium]
MTRSIRNPRRLVAGALVGVVAVSAVGFAASNTVSPTLAGDGSNTISGYTVSDVDYVLDATDPSLLASVDFDLSAAASSVRASVTGSAPYATCTSTGGNGWTCPVTDSVLSVDELRVIAAE